MHLIVNIYNLVGALVKSEKLNGSDTQFDVADLSNGVYIVEIKSKDYAESQKLIIQK